MMINLDGATMEDRLIVGESPTFRSRVQQALNQAALNISNERPAPDADPASADLTRKRVELAKRMLQAMPGWTSTMTPSIVAVLADTSDASIMNAIGGVFNSYLPS